VANAIYDKAREAWATGQINWTSDTIKLVLVDTGAYTVNLATHQFLSDIPAGARIGTSPALSSKTATAGVLDAADVTTLAVPGTVTVEAAVIIKDTGVVGTSPVLIYMDSATSGLPFTTNGSDVLTTFPNDANKIAKL
jgi:hypothetical protein